MHLAAPPLAGPRHFVTLTCMQAVILAAGRGTRMGALTEHTPKPLLQIAGKTLIERELDVLPSEIDEVIIIVGYLGTAIQQRLGGEYAGKRLLYIEQDVLDGTAGALWRAAPILKGRFLVLMSDDLYLADDAVRCISANDWVMLVKKVDHMIAGGYAITDETGTVTEIREGNHGGKSGRISTNMFALDTRVFQFPMVPKSEGSTEFGLPQTVLAASKNAGIPFTTIDATFWFQISTPEDLKSAESFIQA